jgi:hypothetical protein
LPSDNNPIGQTYRFAIASIANISFGS